MYKHPTLSKILPFQSLQPETYQTHKHIQRMEDKAQFPGEVPPEKDLQQSYREFN